MLSDLCRDEFDFAWRTPTPQFADSIEARHILQQAIDSLSGIDVPRFGRDTISAAIGTVIQTGGYSYGLCMKVLRTAVCGAKVCVLLASEMSVLSLFCFLQTTMFVTQDQCDARPTVTFLITELTCSQLDSESQRSIFYSIGYVTHQNQ